MRSRERLDPTSPRPARRRARRVLTATVAVASIAGLASCGDSGSSASSTPTSAAATAGAPAKATTVIDKVAFVDKEIKVSAGGVVVFDNKDNQPHTATADDSSFDTGLIAAGATKELTFAKAGTYMFHCSLHPFMAAQVVVA